MTRGSDVGWTESPWLGFDTETTVVDPTQARLVTAALTLRDHEGEDHCDQWLADPGVDIPAEASKVHGISTARAQEDGADIVSVLDEVANALVDHWSNGWPVVIFNAPYDLTLMECELSRHKLATLRERLDGLPMIVVDPLVLDRCLDIRRRGKRRLTDMVGVYDIEARTDAHNADADVAMTLDLLDAMTTKWEKIARMGSTELNEYQRRASLAWAANFEKYLRRYNPNAVVERGWPLLHGH